ncbi:MAG: TlpA disulfide reductase family protein [Bacteroidales bacterium]|jgi:peroxiredoxin|nr:TlpA disulfide reductase family protein [Bacteroidales bacterium]
MKTIKSYFAAVIFSAALFSSCTDSNTVRISGTVQNLLENDAVLLKRLDFTSETLLDTLEIDEKGGFGYSLTKGIEQPGYYYLYAGERRIASLILKKGDRVYIQTSADGKHVSIEGSEESLLLQQVNDRLDQTRRQFDSLYVLYENAASKEKDNLSLKLGSLFIRYKQDAIRFFYQHPRAFVNTSLVFHEFPGPLYIFSDTKDAPLLRRVYDSLYVEYPLSPYVMAIRDRYESMEKSLQMEQALDRADVIGFPDICLPGLDGLRVCLSSLKGKTIILSFWHAANVNMRLDNRELMDIYQTYAPQGLEVFQVALDTDKTSWARAVREQSLPWISVCDGLGVNSPAVATYNIVEIPAYFIINSHEEIIARSNNVDEVIRQVRKLF